jgi:hypothetical protein
MNLRVPQIEKKKTLPPERQAASQNKMLKVIVTCIAFFFIEDIPLCLLNSIIYLNRPTQLIIVIQ